MRRFVVVLSASILAFVVIARAQQVPRVSVIAGRVVTGSEVDARPVRHARVELTGGGLSAPRFTETDAQGAFRFEARLAGNSRLRVRKPGFVTFDGRPAETITLIRGAAIEGTVVDTDGAPLENARVTLTRTDGATPPEMGLPLRTDDLGRYRAHSLPSGEYLVFAESAPLSPQLAGEMPGASARAFYPSAARAADARAVHLDAGAEARGIDITLDPPQRAPSPAFVTGPIAAKVGARIAGRIIAADTGRPIKGAVVTILAAEGPHGGFQARTQADGRFAWSGVPPGRYSLTAEAARFVLLVFGQQSPSDMTRAIELENGENFDHADLALPPNSAIEGHVLDEFGDPAPGVVVQAVQRRFSAGRYRLMPPGNPQRGTDDTGHFRLTNLAPGTYYLFALAAAFAEHPPSGLAPTYFPGTSDPGAAQPVPLDTGVSRTDIVMTLQSERTFRVSGRVIDADGKPVGRRGVLLLQTQGGDVVSFFGPREETRADGSFDLAGVAPGSYVLQSAAAPPLREFGSTVVQVSERDIDDVVLRVSGGATARGHITFEGEAPLPTADDVRLFPAPVEFTTSPALEFGSPAVFIDRDWSFEIPGLSGLRVFTSKTVPRGQWMLKSVTLNGFDVTDAPLDFRKGSIDKLEVTFTSRVPHVSGSVVGEDGAVVKDCTVVLFALDRTRWAYPSRYLQIARPAQNGDFRVIGLPPEDYLAVALRAVDAGEWQNPEFLESLRPLATAFTLSDGEAKTLSLKLQKQ